jgi:hypothetical protein
MLLAVPALGQTPGDLNCNNYTYEISDAIRVVQTLTYSCSLDSIAECLIQNSDMDGDSIYLTVGDYVYMSEFIAEVTPCQCPQNPSSDTLRPASGEAYPGQTLTLPLDLMTADTLSAFEFYLVVNPQYLTIDTLLAEPGFEIKEQLCLLPLLSRRAGFAVAGKISSR